MPQTQEATPGLLTTDQLENILRVLVAEIRKPAADPIKEIQKAREKATKDAGHAAMWAEIDRRKKSCTHMRQGGGSCAVAWATQSDGVERGVCPHCSSLFTPDDGELYNEMRRRPRGMLESVRYVTV
jgi:hypothetical protein